MLRDDILLCLASGARPVNGVMHRQDWLWETGWLITLRQGNLLHCFTNLTLKLSIKKKMLKEKLLMDAIESRIRYEFPAVAWNVVRDLA